MDIKLKAEIFGTCKHGKSWGNITLDVLAYYQSSKSVTVNMPCHDDVHGDFTIVVAFPKKSYNLIVEY
ncbi:MAG: hypothetical protein GY755_21545 [Chloroflexi bacterium]|nr:hypothetical protein [Chloroflexota bacterium]